MRIGYSRLAPLETEARTQSDILSAAGCERIFADKGISAITVHKPGLEDALAAATPGDILVVCSLDRLARNISHLMEIVAGLESAGLGFVSLSEGIDTGSANVTFYDLMRALAQFDRAGARDRFLAQKSGAASAKTGRPSKLSDEQWAQVKLDLAKPKATITEVAADHGVNRCVLYYRLAEELPVSTFKAFSEMVATGVDRAEAIARLGLFEPAVAYREGQAKAVKSLSQNDRSGLKAA